MKNWEEAYNDFDITKFEELKSKIDDKKCTKEEMKEFKKMNKIHDNLPKVKNLMDYKKNLQKKLDKLKEIKSSYENKAKYDKEKAKLEEEMEKYSKRQQEIDERKKEIDSKLNNSELSDEDKAKLSDEKNKLNFESVEVRNKIDRNNAYFAQNEQKLEKEDGMLRNQPNIEEINREIFKTSSKISKCNFVAGKLMEGYDLESDFIKEKLTKDWKDRRFTSKEPIQTTKKSEEKIKDKVEKKPEHNELEEEKENEYEPIWSDSKLEKKAEKEQAKQEKAKEKQEEKDSDGLPIKEESFEEAFPKLSKIMPKFIKESKLGKAMIKAKQKRENKNVSEIKPKVASRVNLLIDTEKPLIDTEKPEEKEFKESLKVDYDELLEIANKGEDGIRREKLDKLKEKAIAREEENKDLSQEEKLEKTEKSVNDKREEYIEKLEEKYKDEGR